MRCLAIADAARELGENTMFILADSQAAEMIHERGYNTIILNSLWNNLEMELDLLQKTIDQQEINTLLVDSYQVTQNYLRALSEWTKITYIDDLNAFTYPVHTLICYVNYWKRFCHKEKYCETDLLLGPRYTPLRKAFKGCGKKLIKPEIENLLLLSGGTDSFHLLENLLKKIEKKKYKNIDVVCGKYYPDYEQLCLQYKQYKNIHFHKAVNNIEDYMMQADMAVSAGGTTLYELCACGTPTISYSFADNQLNNVLQFEEDGMIDYAGDVRHTNIFENVSRLLNQYYDQPRLREIRSEKIQKLVDGSGSKRIAERLIKMSQ